MMQWWLEETGPAGRVLGPLCGEAGLLGLRGSRACPRSLSGREARVW